MSVVADHPAAAPTPTDHVPTGVFDRPDMPRDSAHERVVFCQDPDTGLRAIIAVHSTALGPALGGTRFY
ncbi:Glu/Leu/Phe/Val dehydrogenase dimerization domain-containing protein, partial [Rhodococcus sp. EPR-279]|uniref:Glu/Leu/Phe/Val dehydrogenase dimerization domain-containing protein n=1 Tax=Rhodococcus sp. EPR-279 TaxID=1813678 RepID=UPI000A8D36D7